MQTCDNTPGLMPIDQAIEQLLAQVSQVTETECIKFDQGSGRTLASAVKSPIDVPNFNNSAMDGYALCLADNLDTTDLPKQFTLVGCALAGQPYLGELSPGQCIRIMTGAKVPSAANAVIMQENTQMSDQQVTIHGDYKLGQNIRLAGEDISQQQEVFPAGHQLKTVDVGLIASLGIEDINVYRKVKIAVMATGDELKQPGQSLNDGDIYETNRTVLKAMLAKLAVDVIDFGIIADDQATIKQAFIDANQQADIVISSGGVSVGDADYVKEVLAQLGTIEFWKVAIKPGKPFAFGKLSDSYFFGLPGNPVSATVTFDQLVLPALNKIAGTSVNPRQQLLLNAVTTRNIRKRPGRADYQRAVASIDDNGQLTVTPLSRQGSGVLSSLSQANCYLVLAQDNAGVSAGESVKVLMFGSLLN